MKIVIVVEDFNPNSGYLESYLAKEMSWMGHKVYIFAFKNGKKVSKKTVNGAVQVFYLPYMTTIVGAYQIPNFSAIKFLIKFLETEKPDIVHCQPLDSPLSMIFIIFKNIFQYKIVGSIATQLNLVFQPWSLKKQVLFCLSKIITTFLEKRIDLFFAKTDGLASIFSRSYSLNRSKFRIIPLGSDQELFKFNSVARSCLRKKLGFSEDDIVIVYSGKLEYSKRLHILMEAMALITKENTRVKLLIIGKGDSCYIEFLKRLACELAISKNVIFHPWVSRETLSALYSASDIGVWPGLSSTSIVDAASVGLPLIIADYPVEIYAIENCNGFKFKIDDADELREYLTILIYDNEVRKEMGRKSRELVEQKLNWKMIAMQYLNAYNFVLNGYQCEHGSILSFQSDLRFNEG